MKKSFLFSALGIAFAIALVTVSNLTAQAPADDKPAKEQRVFVVSSNGYVNEVHETVQNLLKQGWTVSDVASSGGSGIAGIIVLEK